MPDLRLTLPLPPSVNHCYRRFTNRAGRRMNVMTKAGTDWTELATALARSEMNRTGWTVPQQEKVVVEYTIRWPDRRRRDPSNLEKVMLDALQCVTGDDQYVLPRCMDFTVDKARPGVDVVVRRA
jgi:crossover junction endodeoxyribonuclease RusA